MRVSLVARFVSHPAIDFGSGRRSRELPRLGLRRAPTVYHRPRRQLDLRPSIGALRSQTSRFHFPSLGRLHLTPARRAVPPFGLPRARRA